MQMHNIKFKCSFKGSVF